MQVAEQFLFFWIEDATKFKEALKEYEPTSSEQAFTNLEIISEAKGRGRIADIVQTQIAFSRAGLSKLGFDENVGDERFDGGSMRRDKSELGDGRQWDAIFDNGNVDGVFVIAAPSEQSQTPKVILLT